MIMLVIIIMILARSLRAAASLCDSKRVIHVRALLSFQQPRFQKFTKRKALVTCMYVLVSG